MIARVKSMVTGDGLKARALRGTALTITNTAGGQLLRLISNLILTRLLFPEAFGLMALVTVFITGLNMFSDVGLQTSVVQNKRGDDPDFLNTAWTLQIARGALLWLATIGLAVPLANFYEEPQLAELLPVAGLGALIAGFNSTAMLTANRHLMLGRLTALMLGCQTVSIIAMVCLAWLTESVWALVLGPLVGGSLRMLLSHIVLPGIRNRLHLEAAAAWDMFHFGKYIFISTIATFVLTSGDRAILSKFVTLTEVALYSIAFFMASAPVTVGRALANKVLFPLYTNRPPAKSAANRAKINKARRLVTVLIFLACATLALFGEPIVHILYDPRYYDAGLILSVLACSALPGVIVMGHGVLILSSGRSDLWAAISIVSAVLRVILYILAAKHFGVIGVAIVPAIAEIIMYPAMVFAARKYSGWDVLHDVCAYCAFIALSFLVWAIYFRPLETWAGLGL